MVQHGVVSFFAYLDGKDMSEDVYFNKMKKLYKGKFCVGIVGNEILEHRSGLRERCLSISNSNPGLMVCGAADKGYGKDLEAVLITKCPGNNIILCPYNTFAFTGNDKHWSYVVDGGITTSSAQSEEPKKSELGEIESPKGESQ